MAKLATFKDFIKVREYIYLKYDYYARLGRMRDNLSPEEELQQHACWELIRDLKGFMDNVEENFEDPDRMMDFLVDDKVIPITSLLDKLEDQMYDDSDDDESS
tara:strand:+ start:166 stop:474 length:309 start_codon:yes stop_codon:yes gene_type:complete